MKLINPVLFPNWFASHKWIYHLLNKIELRVYFIAPLTLICTSRLTFKTAGISLDRSLAVIDFGTFAFYYYFFLY